MTPPLSCTDLHLRFGKTNVLNGISVDLPKGKISAIIGPNGSGKTSLLRCMGRLQRPSSGEVQLEGQTIAKMNTRDVARRVALLPQTVTAPAGMRVGELITRGRTPHQSPIRQWSAKDEKIVRHAMTSVGLAERADHLLEDLSGGQRQRAWIAMVLAQDTDILLLDEPTTYLDLTHQRDVLSLIQKLQAERQLTVAMVLHDINLAARFSDHIIALKDGKLLTEGDPMNVITQTSIQNIYELDCNVLTDPHSGMPHVIPK
ncbi:MAG: ABC transporter ATP-binding protein [Paracoccaceae bacterium]